MITYEHFGFFRKVMQSRTLLIKPVLKVQHVLQSGPPMFAHIAEWQIPDIHAVNNERAGNTQDCAGVIGTEFLIFGKNRHAIAAGQMRKHRPDQFRRFRRQIHGVGFPGRVDHAHFHLVAFSER